MREAGIKTWMITGDKVETAINIGRSCGLIKEGAHEILFDCDTLLTIKKKLNDSFSLLREQEESNS
jgi:phospholipid-translocating ATPase